MIHRQMLLALVCASTLIGSAACSSQTAAAKGAVRILIEFRDPVDGAAPALLAELSRRSGAGVRYSASVSEKLHAYELACPSTDANCASAIENLRTTPAIVTLSADQLRRTHQDPSKP
ncbi:MAG: hypothetical protein PHX10_07535 [Gallionellaceae bacterium]|nr:hypothetical protein [Gallionellaceae bacterium]